MTLPNISFNLNPDQINAIMPMLLFGLIVLVFALAIALSWLILSYRKAVSKLTEHRVVQSKLLAKSEDQSMEIINKAQQQAAAIIQSTDQFVRASNQNFEKNLKTVSEQELSGLKQTLTLAKQEIEKVTQEISNQLKDNSADSFEQVRKAYSVQLEKAYGVALSDIEKYKKEKSAEVDKKVLEMVRQITAEVLNTSLTQKQHSELVVKALEEARKKHVF